MTDQNKETHIDGYHVKLDFDDGISTCTVTCTTSDGTYTGTLNRLEHDSSLEDYDWAEYKGTLLEIFVTDACIAKIRYWAEANGY